MADYTIAAMYFLNKKISWFADSVVEDVKAGRWGAQVIRQNDYRLINQVLLIIGLGDIGSVVAKKANALGIKVLALKRAFTNIPIDEIDRLEGELEEILHECRKGKKFDPETVVQIDSAVHNLLSKVLIFMLRNLLEH